MKKQVLKQHDTGLVQDHNPFDTTLQLCLDLLEEINSPRSLSIALLIRANEWDVLANGLPIEAEHYLDAEEFNLDYQATCLLMKADFLPTSFDKRAEALVRFESAETLCVETNRRWRSIYVQGAGLPDPLVDRIISMTRRKIEHILGRFPSEELLDHCRWGPGATSSIRNPRTSVYEKYLEPITGSGPCLTLYDPLIREVALWDTFQRGPRCVSEGNKVALVPKNAKTLRSIAAEPSIDSFFQLGIGRLMRKRLLRHGVDLSSQQMNQDLARYGSITGKVATVDLSMASDTAAKVVIDELFPADWLLAMKSCRSPSWRRGDVSGVYAKFSSMGNGYTFEMETLLFYATASAVAEHLQLPWWEVTSYGDDITIGVEGVPLLRDVLSFLGFKFNASKSHDRGVFRESCGKDFFLGTNVRPYFVRSVLRDARDLTKFHNGVLKGLVAFRKTAAKALRLIDKPYRMFGPKRLGDNVLWSEAPRGWFIPASRRFPMFEGFIVRQWVFLPSSTRFEFLEPGVLASLYTLGASGGVEEPRWRLTRGLRQALNGAESVTEGKSVLRERGTWVTRRVLIPGWDE